MSSQDTQFKKGNKAAKKNPKIVIRKFIEMLENARTDKNILSYEDACASINWRDSKCNYWSSKISVFATLKTDIQSSIRRRINKGALEGDYQPASAIWRMKQLGESDVREIKQDLQVTSSDPLKAFREALNEPDNETESST